LYTQSKKHKSSTGKSPPLSPFESTPSMISLKNYTNEGTLETKDSNNIVTNILIYNIQLDINLPILDPVSSISGAKQLNGHETFSTDYTGHLYIIISSTENKNVGICILSS
jgi:hypothetical protein